MKKGMYGFVLIASLFLTSPLFAATEDELRVLMTDARGASEFGDFDNAMSFCDQAIEAKPDFAEAYALRAQAKAALNDMEGARTDAQKAVELAPDEQSIHPAYYVQAVLALDVDSKPDAALASITKAVDLTASKPVAEYYELRADIHKAMGNQSLADADMAKSDEILGGGF